MGRFFLKHSSLESVIEELAEALGIEDLTIWREGKVLRAKGKNFSINVGTFFKIKFETSDKGEAIKFISAILEPTDPAVKCLELMINKVNKVTFNFQADAYNLEVVMNTSDGGKVIIVASDEGLSKLVVEGKDLETLKNIIKTAGLGEEIGEELDFLASSTMADKVGVEVEIDHLGVDISGSVVEINGVRVEFKTLESDDYDEYVMSLPEATKNIPPGTVIKDGIVETSVIKGVANIVSRFGIPLSVYLDYNGLFDEEEFPVAPPYDFTVAFDKIRVDVENGQPTVTLLGFVGRDEYTAVSNVVSELSELLNNKGISLPEYEALLITYSVFSKLYGVRAVTVEFNRVAFTVNTHLEEGIVTIVVPDEEQLLEAVTRALKLTPFVVAGGASVVRDAGGEIEFLGKDSYIKEATLSLPLLNVSVPVANALDITENAIIRRIGSREYVINDRTYVESPIPITDAEVNCPVNFVVLDSYIEHDGTYYFPAEVGEIGIVARFVAKREISIDEDKVALKIRLSE